MDAKHRRTPRRVLLSGDFLHSHFAAVREFLTSCEDVQVEEVNLLDAPAGSCDVIALCQSRPGQCTQADVERLHARAPLANLLAILGSWCEGETRSGRPWHGVERVYWYDAIGRLQRLLESDGKTPSLRTLTAAERIDCSATRWPVAGDGVTAAIFAQRRSEYEPLADVCRLLNLTPRWERSWEAAGPAPALVLATLEDLQAGIPLEALAAITNTWPNSRRIALLNFPRRSETALLREAGFQHVLGKPLLVADLLACLPGLWVPPSQRQIAAS